MSAPLAAHLMLLFTLGSADARKGDVPSRFTPFMDLLDTHRVKYIVGDRRKVYLEAGQAWLCLATGKDQANCYSWPKDWPRLDTIEGWLDRKSPRLTARAGKQVFEFTGKAGSAFLRLARLRCPARPDDLAYTLPPSERRKLRVPPCPPDAPKPGTRLEPTSKSLPAKIAQSLIDIGDSEGSSDGELLVASVEHGGTSLVSIGQGSDALDWNDFWTCYRPGGKPRRCQRTNLHDFHSIHPESTLPGGWLLYSHSSIGRSGASQLAWVTIHQDRLKIVELPVGGVDGYGGGCGSFFDKAPLPGYCVLVTGQSTSFTIDLPLCVRIGSTVRWRALHVRTRNRWVGERRFTLSAGTPAPEETEGASLPDPPKAGTYRPTPGGWKMGDCPQATEVR